MFEILGNYYNGQFYLPPITGPSSTDILYKKVCPANTLNQLWVCPIDFRDTEKAINSASIGFKHWKKVSLTDRIKAVTLFRAKLFDNKDRLATAVSLETGKPLWDSLSEVLGTIRQIDLILLQSTKRLQSVFVNNIADGLTGEFHFKPIGPHLIITPFNFPIFIACNQIANQLIAGNSFILKPSEKVIYSAQLIIELLDKCNLPPGVVNLINGDGEMARRLTKEKIVRGVHFTGSFESGKNIVEIAGSSFNKIINLQLGGKNTCILHQDTNLNFAMGDLFKACFSSSGQRCTSTSIIAIHRTLIDEFISKFHSMAKNIIIDHPIEYDEEPFMGPLIDQHALDKYLLFIGMAKREGIQEIMRGKHISKKYKGYYVSPSIHYSEKFLPDSHFFQSEMFGPNCTFIPYNEIEEAVEIANSTTYGLISSIYSNDKKIQSFCQDEIETGTVNINAPTTKTTSALPFGGIYNSGNFRPVGLTAIDQCVYPKSSIINLDTSENKILRLKGLKESSL